MARVAVDVSLPHLDRPFDYLVPAELAEQVAPGVRVRVRFAGRLVDGLVIDRVARSDHSLTPLSRLTSPEPVLRPEIAELARAVADRYAGTLADVLRLAVPPRHARVEAQPSQTEPLTPKDERPVVGRPVVGHPVGGRPEVERPEVERPEVESTPTESTQAECTQAECTQVESTQAERPESRPAPAGWAAYRAGPAYLAALAQARPARAVLTVLPGEDWPDRIAEAVAATRRGGRGAVVVVPDGRDLARLDAAMTARLGPGAHVALNAALGPAERYRRFLRASRRTVDVVIGTRAAAFAPMASLGLVAIWDDGDDLHAEPHAPYPHALAVLLLRAQLAGAGALVAATARSAEAQLLIETRWAKEIVAGREVVRSHAPAVAPTGDDIDRQRDPAAASARLPSLAWRTARDALAAGAPVLVQVPRRGYVPSVSCVRCRAPARCATCAGPLELRSSPGVAACRWCGRPAVDFACPHCGGRRLRAAVVGAGRTAEELGRAFPGTPVRTSGRDDVLDSVPGEPALVVATPGAEPVAEGGYGAVLLLDTWALLTRADLRAGEEALRRWMVAATLARPASRGGRVVVVADGGLITVQALIRWDPATFAARELAERRELGFPPAARMASLAGAADAVADLLAVVALPPGAEVLGPVPVGGPSTPGAAAGPDAAAQDERALVRVASRSAGGALAEALHAAAGVRSARKAPGAVRMQIDPRELW